MKHFSVRWIRLFLFAVSLGSSNLAATDSSSRKLAFERDTGVWVANVDGTSPKKIAVGQWPDLSPDGTMLAFTVALDATDMSPRKIAVVNLATGKKTIFLDLPKDNLMQPHWSPDGKELLVSYMVESKAHIAILNADGSGFHAVGGDALKTEDYWSPIWAADGQSLFVQDMENIFRIGLDGKVLKKWVIQSLVPGGSMSSSSRLAPSPDGKTLLMDVEMNEDAREGWDGPPPAIWTLDFATDKMTRLTPKKFYAWDCQWLEAPDEIFYATQKPHENNPSIYRMSATGQGKDSKLVIKNASLPATSR